MFFPPVRMGKWTLPARWLDYSPVGNPLRGTPFIVFKTPLKSEYNRCVPKDRRFTVEDLVQLVPKLGLVIDLTATDRYVDISEYHSRGIQHKKIQCKGVVVPDLPTVKAFFNAVDEYLLDESSGGKYIGVHCTHGLNRSGYLVVRYMIQRLGFSPKIAIPDFEDARGYPIERSEYTDHLKSELPNMPFYVPSFGLKDFLKSNFGPKSTNTGIPCNPNNFGQPRRMNAAPSMRLTIPCNDTEQINASPPGSPSEPFERPKSDNIPSLMSLKIPFEKQGSSYENFDDFENRKFDTDMEPQIPAANLREQILLSNQAAFQKSSEFNRPRGREDGMMQSEKMSYSYRDDQFEPGRIGPNTQFNKMNVVRTVNDGYDSIQDVDFPIDHGRPKMNQRDLMPLNEDASMAAFKLHPSFTRAPKRPSQNAYITSDQSLSPELSNKIRILGTGGSKLDQAMLARQGMESDYANRLRMINRDEFIESGSQQNPTQIFQNTPNIYGRNFDLQSRGRSSPDQQYQRSNDSRQGMGSDFANRLRMINRDEFIESGSQQNPTQILQNNPNIYGRNFDLQSRGRSSPDQQYQRSNDPYQVMSRDQIRSRSRSPSRERSRSKSRDQYLREPRNRGNYEDGSRSQHSYEKELQSQDQYETRSRNQDLFTRRDDGNKIEDLQNSRDQLKTMNYRLSTGDRVSDARIRNHQENIRKYDEDPLIKSKGDQRRDFDSDIKNIDQNQRSNVQSHRYDDDITVQRMAKLSHLTAMIGEAAKILQTFNSQEFGFNNPVNHEKFQLLSNEIQSSWETLNSNSKEPSSQLLVVSQKTVKIEPSQYKVLQPPPEFLGLMEGEEKANITESSLEQIEMRRSQTKLRSFEETLYSLKRKYNLLNSQQN